MAAPTCMMDPNVHRAKNWLTRVRMEVGRRSREGREQENNDGRHVGLDKKPSLMEVSAARRDETSVIKDRSIVAVTHRRLVTKAVITIATLAGCGGSQPPIGAPGAMPYGATSGITAQSMPHSRRKTRGPATFFTWRRVATCTSFRIRAARSLDVWEWQAPTACVRTKRGTSSSWEGRSDHRGILAPRQARSNAGDVRRTQQL